MTMKGNEDKDDQEETWQEFHEENRIIPPHPSRLKAKRHDGSFPFCLTLKSIEGVVVPPSVVSYVIS